MATEMVGHRLVPLEQDKNLGGALCGWHRPRPPNAPKALKEWPLGCEASIGSRGRPTARSKLLERPWDRCSRARPCGIQARSSSAFTIRLSATCRYDVSMSSATSAQSTGATVKSSASHPPGPKYGGT
jgi:hypothetical protein